MPTLFRFLMIIDILCIVAVIVIQVWISYDVDEFVMKPFTPDVLIQKMRLIGVRMVTPSAF